MLRVYTCITTLHDLRLLAVAVLISVFACYTAMNLIMRTREASGAVRFGWLAASAGVAGCGVWAMHFIAMLAFKPSMPVGYDLGPTVLSIVAAVAISWIGLAVALRPAWAALGGAIVGLAIAAMHFIGMTAIRTPAVLFLDPAYVTASVVLGVSLSALALQVAFGNPHRSRRFAGALLLATAICGLHFTAMAAITFQPDAMVAVAGAIVAPQWLAIGVAVITAMIGMLGLVGSAFDRLLAKRSREETQRLSTYVQELEDTRQKLEQTMYSLEAALETATASSEAKSLFIASMSHELRTPLNAVIGFSEILSTEIYGPLGDARYLDYVRSIHDSGVHLLGLITDILDVSRIDTGNLKLNEEEIDPREVAGEALRMVRSAAQKGKVRLCDDFAPGLPRLRADQRRVRQVLLNLLSNAVKFTPEGGEVRVSAFCRGDNLALAVADTGIGMAPEDIPKARDLFGQVDNRLNRKFDGTGLGIPLAERLMKLHGGTLEIDSAADVGTTVTIIFPAERTLSDQRAA